MSEKVQIALYFVALASFFLTAGYVLSVIGSYLHQISRLLADILDELTVLTEEIQTKPTRKDKTTATLLGFLLPGDDRVH